MTKDIITNARIVLITLLFTFLNWEVLFSQDLQIDTIKLIGENTNSLVDRSLVFVSDSGYIRLLRSIQNGQLNGMQIQYYPNGRIKSISQYSGLCQIGDEIEFHESGHIMSYFRFIANEKDTIKKSINCYCIRNSGIERYDSTSYPIYSVMNGVKYYFDYSGILQYGVVFKNNAPTGVIQYYDHHGNITNTIYKKPECECELNDGN